MGYDVLLKKKFLIVSRNQIIPYIQCAKIPSPTIRKHIEEKRRKTKNKNNSKSQQNISYHKITICYYKIMPKLINKKNLIFTECKKFY